jgi:hypothetical protein
MKFIVSAFITASLAFGLGLFLPWWSIAIAGFLTGFSIPQQKFLSMLSAFIGVFLFWGGLALYISFANNHILAQKIAMLVVKSNNPYALIALTASIGGITAGLTAFTGRSLAIVFKKNN